MLKLQFTLVGLIFVILLLSCASTPVNRSMTPYTSNSTTITQNTYTTAKDISVVLNESIGGALSNIRSNSIIALASVVAPNQEFIDFLTYELEHSLVSKQFVVVDRSELNRIREEQQFQHSGEVDDKTAVSIGRFAGADVIVIARATEEGNTNRLRLRILDTQTALVIGTASELFSTNLNMKAVSTRQQVTTTAQRPTQTTTQTQVTPPSVNVTPPIRPTESSIQGIAVLGSNLQEKLAWLGSNVNSHNTYILQITADETIAPHNFAFSDVINVTVVLRGDISNRTIRLRANGTLFKIPQQVTLVLDNNIILHGHRGNVGSLVQVNGGTLIMKDGSSITGNLLSFTENDKTIGGGVQIVTGTFEMQGGFIFGNTATAGGAVYQKAGSFEMKGGSITDNSSINGGGVYVEAGTFDMTNGFITENTATNGGGVFVNGSKALFNIQDGSITKNTSTSGGGIYLGSGNVNMNGGTISGNKAQTGGGVYSIGTHCGGGNHFKMLNGTITSNTATAYGGGVFLTWNRYTDISTFTKTGGSISGYESDQINGNVVKDSSGNILSRRGHGIFYHDTKRKESTAGSSANLRTVYGISVNTVGNWDQ